ncbi:MULTISPECIES: nuclease-related domain-containing protein [unclassified Methylophaga]|uniref:nuclease-related domain-containing protein n=2 Tax=Methylophaga TaxID=40222 RepID=UPI0023B5C34B|nr:MULTISPECIES: nuclease-related domain-containing protein [unclassified Methylophaga]
MCIALIIRRKRKRSFYSRKLERALQTVKKEEAKSIIIPDGLGGMIEIERLVLIEQGLLIIETYPMSGHLFGADHIDQWTQIIDGRSFKFTNPLHRIYNSKHALQTLAPKIPIFCRIVFSENSNFPKGKPEEVSVIDSLSDDLKSLSEYPSINQQGQIAWERIIRVARTDGQSLLRDV